MSDPFLAEIRIVGFNFPPRGWAFCDGQVLPINQNQSLYSLLGTIYGGDGRTSFALPDLRGRTPVHPGSTIRLGQRVGTETNTLSVQEIPNHDHATVAAAVPATQSSPERALPSESAGGRRPVAAYAPAENLATMAPTDSAGGGSSVDNMQPWLAVNFCIALRGLFPSRS